MLTHIDIVGAAIANIVAVLNPDAFIVAFDENSGSDIARTLNTFITPLLFLGVGIAAMTFLFKRQMTQFFQFAAIALLIALFWWNGEAILRSVSTWLAGLFS